MIKTPKRTHHYHRMVCKHKKKYGYIHMDTESYFFTKTFKRHLRTPKICSCWCCGNPRKFYGNGKEAKTIQELKSTNISK